jgi:glycosyltransferase 2 family protein
VLVYAGVSLLVLLPITVAGLGLREGGYVGLLGLFGVGAADALSLSFVLFAYALCGAFVGFLVEMGGRSR